MMEIPSKDYAYLLSYEVALDVMVKVRGLELGRRIALEWKLRESGTEPELYVTAQVFCGGFGMHIVSQCTHCCHAVGNDRLKVSWSEWLTMPIKYCDLQMNACIVVTVWEATRGKIGVAVAPLFDKIGRLRRGRVQLRLIDPGQVDDDAMYLRRHWNDTELHVDDEIGGEDRTRMWEMGEKYNHDEVEKLVWLDELTKERHKEILSSDRYPSHPKSYSGSVASNSDVAGSFVGVLTIEFPYFEYPVIFEERPYYSETMDTIFLIRSQEEQQDRNRGLSRFSSSNRGVSLSPTSAARSSEKFPWETQLCVIHDPEMMHVQGRAMDVKEMLNPVEEKYRKLNPAMVRGVVDKFLKPNKDERRRIQQIVHATGKLTRKHQDLLWKFSYSLASDKKALIKFVMSVDWDNSYEVSQAEELLNEWVQIDIADALRLLGEEPEFRNMVVRNHAIKILDKASDNELLLYLLQLVQALRYDCDIMNETKSTNNSSATTTQDETTAATPTTPTTTETDEQGSHEWQPGPLARFLIRRAVNSESLLSYFTWYLSTEVEHKESGMLFGNVHKELWAQLRKSTRGRQLAGQLTNQANFVKKIMMMGKEGRGRALTRQNYLQKMLRQSDGKYHELCNLHVSVMHPLWPSKRVNAIDPDSIKVFNSKTQPIKLDLIISDQEKSPVMFKVGDDLRQDQLVLQLLGVMDKMFKDVNLDLHLTLYRVLAIANDEGVMEFVKDSYPLSAVQKNYSTITNFFQKQAKAQYLAEYEERKKKQQQQQQQQMSSNNNISNDSDNTQQQHQHHQSNNTPPLNVRTEGEIYDEIVNRFIKSCAGYAMCTYVLCVGDRHLDNIMIRSTGELFHIDFGYIFGHDPRSWAVNEIRLTSSMIAAIGGKGSPGFEKFRSHCIQAYMVLRKNSSLILNLIHLMKDSKIENLFDDHEAMMQIVRDRFELDRSDESAEIWLLDKISRCEDTFITTFSDRLHEMNVVFN